MNTASQVSQPFSVRAFAELGLPLLLVFALGLNFLTRVGHDEQRIVETVLLFLIALLTSMRMSIQPIGWLAAGPGGRGLLAFFLLGTVSATMAYLPRYAFLEVSIFLLLMTVALALGAQLQRTGVPGILLTLQAMGCACALNAVRILVHYCASFALRVDLEAMDLAPGFSNFRFFNHAQTVLLPLLVLLVCLTPKASRLRSFWFGLVSLWWLTIYGTTGRGTMVGLLAGCAFVAIILKRSAVPYLKTVALTAFAGLVSYLVFLVLLPPLAGLRGMGAFGYAVSRTVADPSSSRFPIWKNAFELIGEHPWFGVGPMHFAHDAAHFHIVAHPHDWILQIGAEWGLPALLCLVFALFWGVRALVQTRKFVTQVDGGSFILPALLLSAGAILVDGLVSGVIVMPQSQLAIAFYLGLAFGWYRMAVPNARARAPGIMPQIATRVVMLAAALAIAWGVYPEMLKVMDNQPINQASAALNRGLKCPRLWDVGFF